MARHAPSFTAGNVALFYLLTTLGFAILFFPSVLWLLFVTGLGLGVLRIVILSNQRIFLESIKPKFQNGKVEGKDKTRILEDVEEERWALVSLVVLVGIFLVLGVLQAAAPPYVRDSLLYHLLWSKEYIKAGRILHIDGNLFSAFPKGHEALMTVLLPIAGDRVAQGFSLVQHLAMAGAVYSLVRLLLRHVRQPFGCAKAPPLVYFSSCSYVEPALLMTLSASLLALSLILHPLLLL